MSETTPKESPFGWKTVRAFILNYAEKFFVDFALKKILGSALGGGFKVWLVKTIATKLFDEVAAPILRAAIRKGYLFYDIQQGKILIKKVMDAKEEGRKEDYYKYLSDV